MHWRNDLKKFEQEEDWGNAIALMKETIKHNPNDMDAYIAINYLLMEILVEKDHDESNHDYYEALIKHYFTESYAKFSHNPEYLFFTGITSFMSEWYFGIELEDGEAMVRKAMDLEPENVLYQWGYMLKLKKHDNQKAFEPNYAKMVLSADSPIKKALENKGTIGKYLLGIMMNSSKNLLSNSKQ